MVKQTLDASAHTNFLIWIVKEQSRGTPTENAGLYTSITHGQLDLINKLQLYQWMELQRFNCGFSGTKQRNPGLLAAGGVYRSTGYHSA
jgi:hypothetical protein